LTEDRGLIDTSVAVDIRNLDAARFPAEVAISALTLGELAAGPHAAGDDLTRARRQSHLEFVEANLEALAFDSACARAYGVICAAIDRKGRKTRGRAVDLMIAATALAYGLPLFTRNARDLRGLEDLIEIVVVSA
jgi:predicted nucleic acid-binding protein